MIEEEVAKIEGKRRANMVAYHCQEERKLECLVTALRVEGEKVQFRLRRKGRVEEEIRLETKFQNPELTLCEFLSVELIKTFAVICGGESWQPKHIPQGHILAVDETYLKLREELSDRDKAEEIECQLQKKLNRKSLEGMIERREERQPKARWINTWDWRMRRDAQ